MSFKKKVLYLLKEYFKDSLKDSQNTYYVSNAVLPKIKIYI